ncbi:MAG: TetR/AcrR family transcriptional regulator [Polyangiaceae bacterium]
MEARTAILDAAEQRLVQSGPAGIRLQEVASDVGVSHPTILHHFGSREGLVEAVVARALDSLHARLLEVVRNSKPGADQLSGMLDRCFDALAEQGHGRAFLWLALSGYTTRMEELRVRSLAEAVHVVRSELRRGENPPPTFEDTYFTVLLPALALLAMSVTGKGANDVDDDEPCSPARFRAWMARQIHEHLTKG